MYAFGRILSDNEIFQKVSRREKNPVGNQETACLINNFEALTDLV